MGSVDALIGQKVLLTGSSGFVGKHLVKRLVALGVDVIEADLAQGTDLTDMVSLEGLPPVDQVIHLAAKVYIPYAQENPLDVYRTNFLTTLNILELCRRRGISRLIYVSSYVYGHPNYLPVDENHSIRSHSHYHRSKFFGEELCLGYFDDYGLVPIIFRPFNIYGPGQRREFLIPSVVYQALYSDEITVNDLSPKRDYIYVSDVIEAYVQALAGNNPRKPEVFNLGIGRSYSVQEVIELTLGITGMTKEVTVTGNARDEEIPDCYADISKAEQNLDWKPEILLPEGLEKVVQSFKEHKECSTG